MHFHISTAFAKDAGLTELSSQPELSSEPGQHWFLHRVTIERRKCVIAMEAETRFVLLFCGLTKPAFINFPALFADRYWRVIVSVCAVPDSAFGSIKTKVEGLCASTTWHKFQNRSVQSHIRQAAFELDWLCQRDGFPTHVAQAFAYSIALSQAFRSRYKEKHYIVPLEEFQKIWCEVLDVKPVASGAW